MPRVQKAMPHFGLHSHGRHVCTLKFGEMQEKATRRNWLQAKNSIRRTSSRVLNALVAIPEFFRKDRRLRIFNIIKLPEITTRNAGTLP